MNSILTKINLSYPTCYPSLFKLWFIADLILVENIITPKNLSFLQIPQAVSRYYNFFLTIDGMMPRMSRNTISNTHVCANKGQFSLTQFWVWSDNMSDEGDEKKYHGEELVGVAGWLTDRENHVHILFRGKNWDIRGRIECIILHYHLLFTFFELYFSGIYLHLYFT